MDDNTDPSKEGTGRRALGTLLGPSVHCYTLEVSFYASSAEVTTVNTERAFGATMVSTQTKQTLLPFTPGSYQQLGRDLALSFVDYYGLG